MVRDSQPVWKKYAVHQEDHAYDWVQIAAWDEAIVAEAGAHSVCGGIPLIKKSFRLTPAALELPDVAAARRANFRVTGAQLMFMEINGKPMSQQRIVLKFDDVTDESQGLMTTPQNVGPWQLYDGKNRAIKTSSGRWSHDDTGITEVQVTVDLTGMHFPPPKGTRMSGLLSLNRGWPQEITVKWPESLSQNWALTPMKFSTRLAPLPLKRPTPREAHRFN